MAVISPQRSRDQRACAAAVRATDRMAILRWLGTFIRDGWLALGIALAMFIALEATLSIAFRIRQLQYPAPDPRSMADTYADASRSARYYEDLSAMEQIGRASCRERGQR